MGILRHDAALAVGHADLVQYVRDERREVREPAILPATRRAVLEDQRVVLIEGEQALVAARRSEKREDVRARGRAATAVLHAALRQDAGAAADAAQAPRDDGRDLAAGHFLPDQARHHARELGPGGREILHIFRLVDFVLEQNRAF